MKPLANHCAESSAPQVVSKTDEKRTFKGVWIRASLWKRKDLTWFQKCLLCEIDSLSDNESREACYASNEYLAENMGTTPQVIANELSKLRKKQLIIDWGFDGRKRQIFVAQNVQSDPVLPSSGSEGSLHLEVNKGTSLVSNQTKERLKLTPSVAGVPQLSPLELKTIKERKLQAIETPDFAPEQWEFDQYVNEQDLHEIASKGELYSRLQQHKWHKWCSRKMSWEPIVQWRLYVDATEERMRAATQRRPRYQKGAF